VNPKQINLASNLEKYARLANILILWLDCDREGEAIAFEVRLLVNNKGDRHLSLSEP
jgi:DNA topoisomerase IA